MIKYAIRFTEWEMTKCQKTSREMFPDDLYCFDFGLVYENNGIGFSSKRPNDGISIIRLKVFTTYYNDYGRTMYLSLIYGA